MQLRTMKKTVPDSILEGFSLQVGFQNRAKIDIKGCWRNYEKMMKTKMATKSDLDDHEEETPLGFEARGGGRRRGKPPSKTRVLNYCKDLERRELTPKR